MIIHFLGHGGADAFDFILDVSDQKTTTNLSEKNLKHYLYTEYFYINIQQHNKQYNTYTKLP